MLRDRIDQLKQAYNERSGKLEFMYKVLSDAEKEKKEATKNIENYEFTLRLVKQMALRTQSNIEKELSVLVTYALNAVLGEGNTYTFKVQFIERRNKTEVDLALEENGVLIDPVESTGGGIVDILSFALQISLWAMQAKRTRKVLILDEPLRFLKGGDLPQRGAQMIKEISHKLGLQIIMVSHASQLIHASDKVFKATKNLLVSQVKEGE